MWKIVLCLCALGFSVGGAWKVCPDPEDVLPCYCNPSFNIICENIDDVDELRKFAVNMEGVRTEFNMLVLINSTLQYLPKELLENVNVHELNLRNVSLNKVFENPPVSVDNFAIIRFNSVRLRRGVIWEVFKNIRNLETITMDDTPVSTLGKDFKDNVPHGLRQLEFVLAKTKKFEIGVFNDFKALEKIDILKCKLEELHRGYFPVPFNVQALYFTKNKIKSIPADLFTQMPMLKDISLVGNQIATVPESAFGGRYDQLEMFQIRDNPLKCDCSLKWIVRSKPFWFDGTCASPKIMHGKELQDLTSEDFPCYNA